MQVLRFRVQVTGKEFVVKSTGFRAQDLECGVDDIVFAVRTR